MFAANKATQNAQQKKGVKKGTNKAAPAPSSSKKFSSANNPRTAGVIALSESDKKANDAATKTPAAKPAVKAAVPLITELKLEINGRDIIFEKDKIGDILKSDENALKTLNILLTPDKVTINDGENAKQKIEVAEYTLAGDKKTTLDTAKHKELSKFLLSDIDSKVDNILTVIDVAGEVSDSTGHSTNLSPGSSGSPAAADSTAAEPKAAEPAAADSTAEGTGSQDSASAAAPTPSPTAAAEAAAKTAEAAEPAAPSSASAAPSSASATDSTEAAASVGGKKRKNKTKGNKSPIKKKRRTKRK